MAAKLNVCCLLQVLERAPSNANQLIERELNTNPIQVRFADSCRVWGMLLES